MTSGISGNCYVVDDDSSFRAFLVALLHTAGHASIGFPTAKEFGRAAPDLWPGVAILDCCFPNRSGLDLIGRNPGVTDKFAVVMMSGRGDVVGAVRAIKAGALDFIEKPFADAGLLQLVAASLAVLASRGTASAERHDAAAKITKLSPREHEVLRMIVAGAPNKIVARVLDLSVRTVEMHRANMLAKLDARSTAGAIHLAMLGGVVPWPLPIERRALS